jgi:uncharacterized membrane protein
MEQTAGRPAPQSDTNKMLAALCYILGWLAIIIAMIEPGKTDPFVKFHAWQAFYLGIAAIVVSFITFGVGWIIIFILQIYYAIQAYNGNYFEVPVIYGLAKNQME